MISSAELGWLNWNRISQLTHKKVKTFADDAEINLRIKLHNCFVQTAEESTEEKEVAASIKKTLSTSKIKEIKAFVKSGKAISMAD